MQTCTTSLLKSYLFQILKIFKVIIVGGDGCKGVGAHRQNTAPGCIKSKLCYCYQLYCGLVDNHHIISDQLNTFPSDVKAKALHNTPPVYAIFKLHHFRTLFVLYANSHFLKYTVVTVFTQSSQCK